MTRPMSDVIAVFYLHTDQHKPHLIFEYAGWTRSQPVLCGEVVVDCAQSEPVWEAVGRALRDPNDWKVVVRRSRSG